MDPEILTLRTVLDILKDSDKFQVKRVMDWVKDKFELAERTAYLDTEESETETTPAVEGAGESVMEPKKKDLADYNTVLDVLAESKADTLNNKVILIAAFLQERFKFKEITTHDITFRLQRMGQEVKNLTVTLSNILKSKNGFLMEIKDDGSKPGTRARKKFMVTEQGLAFARGLLAEHTDQDPLEAEPAPDDAPPEE
ncbi:MAG: hypothetical protein ACM3SY_14400 [Candidatus Omnitrophota bacterium]